MSDNDRFRAEKTKKRRAAAPRGVRRDPAPPGSPQKGGVPPRDTSPTLQDQLVDLFLAVKRCEAMWALEERIERGL